VWKNFISKYDLFHVAKSNLYFKIIDAHLGHGLVALQVRLDR